MAKTIQQLRFLTYQRIIQFIGVFISHKTSKNTLFFNFHTFLNTIIFIPNVLDIIIIFFTTTLYPTPPPNLLLYYQVHYHYGSYNISKDRYYYTQIPMVHHHSSN